MVYGVAPGEDVFFYSFDAVEMPVVHHEGAGELEFYGSARVEIGDVFADEGGLSFAVFIDHEGGEAEFRMLEAVEGWSVLCLRGFWGPC